MNLNGLVTDDMSLEEKLQAIDKAMEDAQVEHKKTNPDAPLDPSELTMCEGCQ